jgi:6-phosphofructokinase 2
MHSILTITLNPAVDKNYTLNRLLPEHKLRVPNPQIDAGGGGINVSKGINRLGGKSTILTLTGGRNGELLKELIKKEDIEMLTIDLKEETRESIVISEQSTNQQYRIVVEGPTISTQTTELILETIAAMKPFPSIIVASGSLPKGIQDDFYGRIGKIIEPKGSKYIVDTSGHALLQAVEQGVYLVKPNLLELSRLSGNEQLELDDVDEAAMELIKKGKCAIVVVSLGAAGAMLVTKNECEHIMAPNVKRKSTVGAGDSMVAGMVWGMQQGYTNKEMIRIGIACGSAATLNEGTQLFTKEAADRLYKWLSR